ncbi:MAG: hypothetical protein HJJLKODD_02671 [Phycisphaerae bacterium]|nr:hypothetical protein [Phycisphaerae bacterium]
MPVDIEAEMNSLSNLTVMRLRERYAEVFGEPTRSFNKQHLIKRIAWRLQAIREGDLSERARQRARELANDADLRIRPPAKVMDSDQSGGVTTSPFRVKPDDRLPMAGTLLKRVYKGQMIYVRVLPQGFEFNGEVYRSLSAIAHKITGSHWNGYRFFQLPKSRKETVIQ